MPQLAPEVLSCIATINGLQDLHVNTTSVAVSYRKLICEIAVLRLFYLLENTFKGIACRVASGASYCDGTAPSVLLRCSSLANAEQEMKVAGRPKARNLKWSQVSEIKENLKFVIDPSDHLIRTFDAHGTFIDELRRVRNRIAHNNAGVRSNFRVIVKRHYGAELNGIQPGTLLLSQRRTPPLIEQYLAKSRVLVKALAKL